MTIIGRKIYDYNNNDDDDNNNNNSNYNNKNDNNKKYDEISVLSFHFLRFA